MDYTAVLDRFGCLIEDDLKRQFDQLTKEAKDYHPFMGEVYEAAAEFVLRGGRRLSSCSMLMVYKGYTNEINDGIVRACSGVELYRHSILVHDDIADTELQRRGGKTLHKIFEERQDEHFGIGSAIFMGNILYSLAIRAVLESGFDSDKLVEVTKRFSSGLQGHKREPDPRSSVRVQRTNRRRMDCNGQQESRIIVQNIPAHRSCARLCAGERPSHFR